MWLLQGGLLLSSRLYSCDFYCIRFIGLEKLSSIGNPLSSQL